MNIRDFEYLIAIDHLKSFSKASQQCFISQPALSQQIKKIEDQLGFVIFERNNKNIITTSKGSEVIKYAKEITNCYKNIKNISNNQITLTIGLIPTICPYLLPLIVNNLNLELPQVKFYFLELKTEQLIEKLKDGQIDCGIIAHFDNLIDNILNYQKIYDEEFLLALPKTSKLQEKDFNKILINKELILLEEGNCLSDNIKDICSLYEQNSFNDFYATNIETVKNMIKLNNGAALLPRTSCINEKDLKLIKFKDKKTREIGIVSRKNFPSPNLISQITTICSNNI